MCLCTQWFCPFINVQGVKTSLSHFGHKNCCKCHLHSWLRHAHAYCRGVVRPLRGVVRPLRGVDAPPFGVPALARCGVGSLDGVRVPLPLLVSAARADAVAGIVAVRCCVWCVLYVSVVVLRPPTVRVSRSTVVNTSAVSLSSEMSLPTLAARLLLRELGRLLAWLLAAENKKKMANCQQTRNVQLVHAATGTLHFNITEK